MHLFDKNILPKKIVLSGSDCFHIILDMHAKNNKAGSNVMRLIFYFDEKLSIYEVQQCLNNSPIIYWLCNIQLNKGLFFSAPYWQFLNKGNTITITEHQHIVENEIPNLVLLKDIPLDGERFIECDIIQNKNDSSILILSWNHIAMDGRGISMLVQHLNQIFEGKIVENIENLFPTNTQKNNLFSYIKNMYKVKSFIQKSSKAPIATIASKSSKRNPIFSNTIIRFSEEETQKITKNAFNNGAKFGENLFYLSCATHSVNNLLTQRNKQGTMWLPIPYDGRLKGSFGPIISNSVAYLFYRLAQKDLSSVKLTVKSFHEQMIQQIKDKTPVKYSKLLQMLRHIPMPLYYFLINKTGEGSFASFLYSATGENFNKITHFLGKEVRFLTIYPSPTFPPGLTFSFLKHKNALNINIAYNDKIISEIELETLQENLKNYLLFS